MGAGESGGVRQEPGGLTGTKTFGSVRQEPGCDGSWGFWWELGCLQVSGRSWAWLPFLRGGVPNPPPLGEARGTPPSAFPSCRNQAFGPCSIFLLGSGSGSWLGNLPCGQQEPLQRGGGVLLGRDRFVPGGFLSPPWCPTGAAEQLCVCPGWWW